MLTFEEIERLARLFIRLGVKKIRLTGGEPLLRRGIEQLIEKLARLQTMQGEPLEIALTTNAVLLARKAQALKDAGLNRVTVSLDGLSDATFRRMSDSDVAVATVLEGIAAAQAAGLGPVKVNMVVKRGVNEHEIVPMAEHFRHSGVVLRFIEFMDVGTTNGWRMDDVVPAREILDRIARALSDRTTRSQLQRRSRRTLALCRWRRRDRRDRLGHAGVLPRMHPRPPFHRRQAVYLPVRERWTRFARTAAPGRERHRVLIANLIADRAGSAARPLLATAPREATGQPAKKVEMSYIGG